MYNHSADENSTEAAKGEQNWMDEAGLSQDNSSLKNVRDSNSNYKKPTATGSTKD